MDCRRGIVGTIIHSELAVPLSLIYADATADKKKEVMANLEGKIIL